MASGDYGRRKRHRKPWLGGDVHFAGLLGGAVALLVAPKLLPRPDAGAKTASAPKPASLAPLLPVAAQGGKSDLPAFDPPSFALPGLGELAPGEIKPLKAPEPAALPKLPELKPDPKPPAAKPFGGLELPPLKPAVDRADLVPPPPPPGIYDDPKKAPKPAAPDKPAAKTAEPPAPKPAGAGLPFALPGLPVFGAALEKSADPPAAKAPAPAVEKAPARSAAGEPVHPYHRQFLERKLYYVRQGDTFAGIARRLYGDEARAAALQDANPQNRDAAGQPKPGTVLKLP